MDRSLLWHNVECAPYDADLSVWRKLAQEANGTILDVGAGTGRVTLDLAARGLLVTALDIDATLLTELQLRARSPVPPVIFADAREMGQITVAGFALIIAPMQTVQMLGPAPDRARFLEGAFANLRPGGLLACALSNREQIEAWAPPRFELPEPDELTVDGVRYVSQPVGVIHRPDGVLLKRVRQAAGSDPERNEVFLWRCTPKDLETEALAYGFSAAGRLRVQRTDEHAASVVVLLRRP